MQIHRINKIASVHKMTVQDMGNRDNSIPLIPLKGKWLSREAGIYPRDTVQIDVQPERIVITLVQKADTNSQHPWQRRDWLKEERKPSVGPVITIPKI